MKGVNLIGGNCLEFLRSKSEQNFDLTFLDPPFNQGKDYEGHDDNMDAKEYWEWMTEICSYIFKNTSIGGCIYFMQREKNTQQVLQALETTGWQFQNLIIWKKNLLLFRKAIGMGSNIRLSHLQLKEIILECLIN